MATTSRPMVGSSRNSSGGLCSSAAAKIAAHALAERKLAHGRVQIVANAEDLVETLHARVEIALGNVVNPPQQLERFDDGDVPPELRALPENHADGFHIVAALAKGHEAIDANFAAGRDQNAGEHLDAGGFAGAIRADVADHFAAVDRKADAVNRRDRVVVANEEILDRTPDAFPAVKGAEVLAEVVDVNQRIGSSSRRWRILALSLP